MSQIAQIVPILLLVMGAITIVTLFFFLGQIITLSRRLGRAEDRLSGLREMIGMRNADIHAVLMRFNDHFKELKEDQQNHLPGITLHCNNLLSGQDDIRREITTLEMELKGVAQAQIALSALQTSFQDRQSSHLTYLESLLERVSREIEAQNTAYTPQNPGKLDWESFKKLARSISEQEIRQETRQNPQQERE